MIELIPLAEIIGTALSSQNSNTRDASRNITRKKIHNFRVGEILYHNDLNIPVKVVVSDMYSPEIQGQLGYFSDGKACFENVIKPYGIDCTRVCKLRNVIPDGIACDKCNCRNVDYCCGPYNYVCVHGDDSDFTVPDHVTNEYECVRIESVIKWLEGGK